MKAFLFLILTISIGSSPARELSPKEVRYLEDHDHLLIREMVSNARRPRITILLKLEATPEKAMSLFADFERQKTYVPGLLKSTVIKQLSPTEVHTRYELKMPWPLSNSRYTHGTVIAKNEDRYSIKWYVVESDSTEKIEGLATFENFKGQTLMTYQSLIYPKSALASLFANTMVTNTESSTLAIRDFIEEQSKQKSQANDRSLALLRDSLAGKLVYLK